MEKWCYEPKLGRRPVLYDFDALIRPNKPDITYLFQVSMKMSILLEYKPYKQNGTLQILFSIRVTRAEYKSKFKTHKKILHSWPSQVSYGVSILIIL